jgi:hypothetical protein
MISFRALRQMTIDSRASSLFRAIMTPFALSPTLWPLLPTLCRRRVTCLGELYWMTRSMLPMSIPSSRDDVQTMVLRSPDFSPLSAAMRLVFAREPWCMLRGKSRSQTLNRLASISEVDLVLVKIRVLLWSSIRSCITLRREATSGWVKSFEARS